MNIVHHLSQLLYRYQCVTIPNFGGFITEIVPASIQESNQTFYPPKKNIYFNANIKNNDGLLANHIARIENVSYEYALAKIEYEVNTWKQQLENRDFLVFKGIGTLKLNSENNIVFEPISQNNFYAEAFGLNQFVSPTIKRVVPINETISNIPSVEVKTEETPVYTLETEERRSFFPYVKYAAMFLLSLGGAGFGYASYIQQQEVAETLLVQAEVQKEVQNKIQEATFYIGNTAQPVVMNIKENYKPFHIVAGAFRNESNAQKAQSDLVKNGFEAQILPKNNHDLFPVIYGSFVTYAEAQKQLDSIKKTSNSEAWILIKEL